MTRTMRSRFTEALHPRALNGTFRKKADRGAEPGPFGVPRSSLSAARVGAKVGGAARHYGSAATVHSSGTRSTRKTPRSFASNPAAARALGLGNLTPGQKRELQRRLAASKPKATIHHGH